MKLQKLTIHNIASIEDAVIDFDAEPLANSEVFLITGKTGAGKSTILDAICLALYADTPRLYNTKMQGATYDANKEVKIDNPRQLLRRNTTEAFVSLTFIGSNTINYEATWSVARSYKKLSGSIKNKSWQLTNLDTQKVLTKDIDNITKYEKAIEMLNEVPEKSLQSLLELVEEFDSNPLIYYYIGVAFRRLQKFEEAIHYLRESIKIESGILEVVVELGLNYACLGEYEEALIYFKKAFEASRDVEICTNIIMCYINLKDMKNAKLHLAIAKELNSEDEIVKEIENLISK